MRKLIFCLPYVLLFCIVYIIECIDQSAHIPGNYSASEKHMDPNGFQDYTDFCVYYYASPDAVSSNPLYRKVADSDTEELRGYFSDFEGFMKAEGRSEEYGFDLSCISAGDYCCIETKEGKPIGGAVYGKYDHYTVYFFDTETCTLYYIHNSI